MIGLSIPRRIVRGVRDGWITADDCRLLASVVLVQALALAFVGFVPIPEARKALGRFRAAARALFGSPAEVRVIWAIEASACWRSSTCLTRALTAELLLPADPPLTMVVGIAPASQGGLKSHAWIERDGNVLVGGSASNQYVPLIAWSGRTP